MTPKATALLIAAGLAVGSCSDADGTRASCAPPSPAAGFVLPDDLPLERWGVVVKVERQRGFLGARALSDDSIDDLYEAMLDDLDASGWTFLGGENEGFEAEIYVSSGDRRNGTLLLRKAACERVSVQALIDER